MEALSRTEFKNWLRFHFNNDIVRSDFMVASIISLGRKVFQLDISKSLFPKGEHD